jgi:hypothetical protein
VVNDKTTKEAHLTMIYPVYSPTLSCVVIDTLDPNAPELFLSVNADFSLGKLFRTGLDAVYGLTSTPPKCVMYGVTHSPKEYDAKKVREKICTVPDHRDLVANIAKPILSQGHGNLGMNNWAVAYTPPCMIVPAREPVFERIYPSLIKTRKGDKPEYEIADVMYFYDNKSGGKPELTFDEVITTIRAEPDREVTDNAVYLPVWDDKLEVCTTEERDRRIDYDRKQIRFLRTQEERDKLKPDQLADYGRGQVHFVKLDRNAKGTVEDSAIKAVKLIDGAQAGNSEVKFYRLEKINSLEFAFFGIPVGNLLSKSRDVPSKETASKLGEIIHYFYDLRHVFDLGQLQLPSKAEFYLFEYALKQNDFADAHALLMGKRFVKIDLVDLVNRLQSPVQNGLEALISNSAFIKKELENKGYCVKDTPEEVVDWGDFYLDQQNKVLTVKPHRNVYPYSFIGMLRVTEVLNDVLKNRYLVLGVTHGVSGIRSAKLDGQEVFEKNKPIRAGFALEKAISALKEGISTKITEQLLEESRAKKLPQNPTDIFWDAPGDGLLLLDQGGDVHQWLSTGGLKNVVGSSEERQQIAAELVVGKKV